MLILYIKINLNSDNIYLIDLKQILNKNNSKRNTLQALECVIELELLKEKKKC